MYQLGRVAFVEHCAPNQIRKVYLDVADSDDMLLQVSKKLHEVPFQAETLSSKLTGPDATYRRMLFIQEQNDKIREQQKQLEENDKRLLQKQEELQATINELDAAIKKREEMLHIHEEKIEQLEKIISPKKHKGGKGGTQEQ